MAGRPNFPSQRRDSAGWPSAAGLLGLLAGGLGVLASSSGQVSTVYVDDSVAATESFQRIPDLQASGNLVEVLRVAQRLLDEEGDRLIATAADADLFTSVRARVHALLLTDPALLARYRQLEGPRAEVMVTEGKLDAVERTRLLTTGGFEATLRLARRDLEAARFDGAALKLAQLQLHPDLVGQGAERAADLAQEIARFTPSASDLAASLARAAGRAVPTVTPVVEPARARVKSPQTGADQGPLDLRTVASEPLASAEIAAFAHAGKPGSDRGASPWVIPTVVGDSLYTNDGVEVAAWDRWTLVPKWKYSTATDDPDGVGFPDQGGLNAIEQASRSLEDSSTVTVGSGVVIATTGFAVNNARRSGDARVHAFDSVLGTPLWSVDLSRLDRQLAEASVRGPAIIVGDTAVVAADRFSMGRRLASSLLVGLDCSTGAIRWVRTLANIGLPPIGQLSRPADMPIAVGGVIYLTDSLGVTAAVEASTGRFVWVHRLQGTGFDEPFRFSRRGETLAWLGSSIVSDDGTLLTVEPGTGDLVRLAASDGRLVGRRILDRNDQPRTLIRVGEYLATINVSGINVYPIRNISESPMQNITLRRGALFAGRPVVSGRTLVVPTAEGIMVVDPENPTTPVSLPLAASGHPVLADGQLFMASVSAVRSFQAWEAVEPKLTAAIAANPKETAPGLAYVRIALRAGKAAGVPEAADRLLAVLDIDPSDPASQSARRSLFELLRATVVASRDLVLEADAPRGPAGGAVVPLAQIDPLLARLARAADTPAERAEHLLLASWAADAQLRHGLAIESLQSILQQPDLAAAVVPSASRSGPALVPGWEAARERLSALLARVGYEPYSPFAAQADRERADLPANPEAGEAFSRRFPASRAAVAVLTQAADMRLAAGQTQEAMGNLGAAIDAARTIAAATRQPMLPDSAAASGRLLTLLAKHGREGEAWRFLAMLDAQAPGVPLSDAGGTIDRVATRNVLKNTLAARERRAEIGPVVAGMPQLLAGWTLVRPRLESAAGRATDQLPMASSLTRQVGLWARRPEDGRMAPLWTRSTDPRALPPSFLRVDWDVSYLYLPGERGVVVECVAADGSTRWRTEPLDTLLPPEPQDGERGQTPQDDNVDPSSMIAVVHDRTLVLMRRSGAGAAFDLTTGKSVWARKLDLTRVYDVTAVAGRLVLIGEFEGPQQPRIVMADLVTGKPEVVLGDERSRLASSPRWVRPAGDRVILGLEDSICALDPKSGAVLWRISGASATKSQECWIIGDRAMVLGGDGRPWMFDWSLETPSPIPFESQAGLSDLRRRRGPDDQTLVVGKGPSNTITVATELGISIFTRAGALVGVDALPVGEGPFLSAVGEGLAVYLQTEAEPDRDGKRELTMWFVELPSARLVGEQSIPFFDTPARLGVLDGKVVVTVGPAATPVSMIFDVPVPGAR